jgi:2-polyprenyl-6-hydroxyphenyl methylase/3-demethylubiquinone-9 3-methyltransferase
MQRDPEHNERKMLQRYVDFAGKSVLEIGCGDGRMTWEYAAEAGQVTGIDPDRDELRVAEADRSYKLEGKVFFAAASARWLPFPRERFDIAVLAWSL